MSDDIFRFTNDTRMITPSPGDLVVLIRYDENNGGMRVLAAIKEPDKLNETQLETLSMIGLGVSHVLIHACDVVMDAAEEALDERLDELSKAMEDGADEVTINLMNMDTKGNA